MRSCRLRIGIIGSGQLGRMMVMEGRKLPFQYYICDTSAGTAASVADRYFSADQYREFVESCDVVTCEFEHVDDRPLSYADQAGKLLPPAGAIELKRRRSREKEFYRSHSLPTAPFSVCDASDLKSAVFEFEKAVVKRSEGGYDGKGQWVVEHGNVPSVTPGEYVVEQWIDFDFEASLIISRTADGQIRCHPPSLNVNRAGMLIYNEAPEHDYGMRAIAERLLESLNYVGVAGIEFFIVDGKAMINEFAPRVHNSGHHTLHGSSISQFEQHLRAIAGLPVPEPELFQPSGILNLIGTEYEERLMSEVLSIPGSHFYWYGKEPRRRRKVGHINLNAPTIGELDERMKQAIDIVYGGRLDSYL